jgi:hypothetical protein
MKKRIGLTLAVGFVASLASMRAAVVPCLADTTLNALILLGSGPTNGCSVFDKLFNNFTYSFSSGGVPATGVEAHLDENIATLTFGWTFTAMPGAFDANFNLGYTVSIITSVCPSCVINSAGEQLFTGTAPPGTQAIAVSESAGTPSVVMLNNSAFAFNTGGNTISPGVLTLTKAAVATGIDSANPLESFESVVHQGMIPEPVTLSLMGIGFLGLSFIGWRRAQK